MKKIYLFSIALIGAFTMQAQDCSNLFISEYVEGWSNNKAIELYNPTNETIDLSNYALSRWSNGGQIPETTVLEGSIAPGKSFVVGIDKRDQMENYMKLLYGMDGTIIPTVRPLYQTVSIQLMKT